MTASWGNFPNSIDSRKVLSLSLLSPALRMNELELDQISLYKDELRLTHVVTLTLASKAVNITAKRNPGRSLRECGGEGGGKNLSSRENLTVANPGEFTLWVSHFTFSSVVMETNTYNGCQVALWFLFFFPYPKQSNCITVQCLWLNLEVSTHVHISKSPRLAL